MKILLRFTKELFKTIREVNALKNGEIEIDWDCSIIPLLGDGLMFIDYIPLDEDVYCHLMPYALSTIVGGRVFEKDEKSNQTYIILYLDIGDYRFRMIE